MKIILAGGRRITYNLAKMLISKGSNVVVINKDKKHCEELSREIKALVINGDASKIEILQRAEIFENDIILALTPQDEDNLIISQLCIKVLNVTNVYTLVNDPENVEVFNRLGIKNVISMTEMLSGLIEQRVSSKLTNIMSFEEGKGLVIQLTIEEDFPAKGIMLKELGLPKGSIVGAITRDEELIVPHGESVLKPGDRVAIMCKPSVQTETVKIISGKD
ncbi:MAG: potassium channel family protein [Thermotogota bacterium]